MSHPVAHEQSASGGYGPPPGGGGYGPPPGGGGYGPPPGGSGYGPPPDGGGYGGPPGGGPPGGGWGPPPGGGFGPPPGAMVHAPFGVHPISGLPYSEKSKVVAGMLQLFVPCVGRFYTGHTTIALLQLGAMIITCGAGALWPMIDGILMLMGKVPDSDGRPLREGS